MDKAYRKCAGIVVFNSRGEVLVGSRLNLPNSWQFPQGGIDKGEEAKQAALRELYEEVGIRGATFVYEHPDWLAYDFPPWLKGKKINKFKGQTQKWFLVYWDGRPQDCDLEIHEREFAEVKFLPIESTVDHVIDFKKQVYQKLIESFTPKIQEYLNSSQ